MNKWIIGASLALLLSLGTNSLFADSTSIDIKDYKVLLPEKIAGWNAEDDIETIKLGRHGGILLHRMYSKAEILIEAQITDSYYLRSDVMGMLSNPALYEESSSFNYKDLKGVQTKEDGDINIQFLSKNNLMLFGLTLLGQANKLSEKDVTKLVEGFIENFYLASLK